MSEEAEEEAAPRAAARGRAGRIGPALRGAATVIFVVVAACLGGALTSWIVRILEPEPDEPAEVFEIRATPSVVVAVRDLARLETTSFHVERVIDMTSRQRRLWGLVEVEDSILLVAAGDVVAGVDLAEVEDRDVEIDGRSATITLPEPQIFTTALDNERTYVYRRETETLARRNEALETRARREAERTLRDAAIEAGLLERARRNARHTVESLVRSLGYDRVEVRFESDDD